MPTELWAALIGAIAGVAGALGGTLLANWHTARLAEQTYQRDHGRAAHAAFLNTLNKDWSGIERWLDFDQGDLNEDALVHVFDELQALWLVSGRESGEAALEAYRALVRLGYRDGSGSEMRAAILAYVTAVRAESGLDPVPVDEWWQRSQSAYGS